MGLPAQIRPRDSLEAAAPMKPGSPAGCVRLHRPGDESQMVEISEVEELEVQPLHPAVGSLVVTWDISMSARSMPDLKPSWHLAAGLLTDRRIVAK